MAPDTKGKVLLLDLTIVIPCVNTNLGNATRQTGKHVDDEVEKKNSIWSHYPLPAPYSWSIHTCPHQRASAQTCKMKLRASFSGITANGEGYGNSAPMVAFLQHHLCRQGVGISYGVRNIGPGLKDGRGNVREQHVRVEGTTPVRKAQPRRLQREHERAPSASSFRLRPMSPRTPEAI